MPGGRLGTRVDSATKKGIGMRAVIGWPAALLGLVTYLAIPGVCAAAELPNIVLILADDLGWSDLGCYGADLHETPHLDRIAGQSLRFIEAYAMPVCSPTRAALLTGKHSARIPMTIWSEGAQGGPTNRLLLQARSLPNLPHTQRTLASYLQQAGYLTALVGKWHLGDADHYPETHGFDINVGGTHWGAPQTFWWPYRGRGRFGNEFRYVPHLEFGQPGEYLTDRLTDEALRILDRVGEQPFLLYLAHHAPHTPIEAKAEDIAYFQSRLQPELRHQNAVYAAMLKSLDESVGRVWERLRERGLLERTIFIFVSDNGGYIGVDSRSGQSVPVTNNAPLRSGKGSCYEGGLRVPLIVSWPGVTSPGTTCSQPVCVMDLFATLLAAANIPLPADTEVDGLDLRKVLREPATPLPARSLYFHYPHYYATTSPVSAVRHGRWKLLEYFEDQRVELYDLQNDLAEGTDLAADQPQRAAQLRQELHAWRASIGAELPRSNPRPPAAGQ